MARYPELTRRRLLHLAGIGLTGTVCSEAVRATDDRKSVFVHPARSGDDVSEAVRANGGEVTYDYVTLDFVAARVPADRVQQLERDRRVGEVEADDRVGEDGVGSDDDYGGVRGDENPDDEGGSVDSGTEGAGGAPTVETEGGRLEQEASWGHDRIFGDSADAKRDAYATATGAGVNVAVLDSGIQHDHQDLAGNVVGGVNFSAGKNWADDDVDHGTHVGGIVAAADNGVGTMGVAPEANLWSVKVFHEGKALVSDIVAGIDWCMENDVEIISMSFSHSERKSAAMAVEAAYDRGHLLVAGAANADNDEDGGCGEDTIKFPAEHDATVAVTAMDADDTIAGYSSVGPDAELIAPGTDIDAPVPDDAYGRKNGTSMACPMVSGVAALAWDACGADGPDVSVRNAVRATLGSEAETVLDTCEEGAGLVRADRVVEALDG